MRLDTGQTSCQLAEMSAADSLFLVDSNHSDPCDVLSDKEITTLSFLDQASTMRHIISAKPPQTSPFMDLCVIETLVVFGRKSSSRQISVRGKKNQKVECVSVSSPQQLSVETNKANSGTLRKFVPKTLSRNYSCCSGAKRPEVAAFL